MASALTDEQRVGWDHEGFFIVSGFAERALLLEMERCVVDLVRAEAAGESIGPAFVQREAKIEARAERPMDALSKLFRIHREQPVFNDFIRDERLLDIAEALLGASLDCFLSQFIAKRPGALGQPWHQDAFYFPFDRGPQVGLWLAVSEARLDNGPLWVMPGSHLEPVHPVVRDRREHANLGYVQIVDHDMKGEIPVPMKAGDLLVFHSHLMHRSTDNESADSRLAMVYHLASGDTVDESEARWGFTPANTDWMPVRRGAEPVPARAALVRGGSRP